MIKDQSIFSMVIILLILITLSLDGVWILLGETCCWSLSALKGLRAQIACYKQKGDLSPVMLKKTFKDSLKILKFTRISIETTQAWLGGKSCLSHTNPSTSNFLAAVAIFRLSNFNMMS